jgi:3',5'-cyclic AMP phosphodiesterase CpdA
MIAQLLNRQFIIDRMHEVRDQLQNDAERKRTGGPGAGDLQASDYEQALAHFDTSLRNEQSQSSGQPGFVPPPPDRRGDLPADLDDYSFFSRDPIVSITQSALEAYFDHPESSDDAIEVPPEDDQRRGPDDAPAVTDRSLPDSPPHRTLDGRRVFDKFSITDVGWVSSLVAMGVRRFRKPHGFNNTPAEPTKLSDSARLILVGDWGTGIPRAQKISTAMRIFVEESVREKRDTHVMHLGDVYYSGWEYEYERRFLRYWPVKDAEADQVGSWCLNGNHDMYSGGYGYFDKLLNDRRFHRQGQASFFRCYNQQWQVLGLDTAWDDNGFKDPQADWVKHVLEQNSQKAILLTHHQFFSAYEPGPGVGKVLRAKLGSVLDSGRAHVAFWGHEHRCVSYEPYQGVQYGRLIGHGGVPVYMTHGAGDPFPKPSNDEYRGYFDKGLERWALFGFAVLDFDGPTIHVRYINENGETHKKETIV